MTKALTAASSHVGPPRDTAAAEPFHGGEHAVHERLGVTHIEAVMRKFVRRYMPDQHRQFYESLPFVVTAARDAGGAPWATLLTGADGGAFITSPDAKRLVMSAAAATRGDPLAGAFAPGADIGLLGTELHSRRRNRVNGRVVAVDEATGALNVAVDLAFGNCPQYIHERTASPRPLPRAPPPPPTSATQLSAAQVAWVQSADTLFLATGHRGAGNAAAFGMDASHRGGDPGFVRATPTRITFPDYAGNNFFQTLGNLQLDARIGVCFVDFATGGLLHITGTATVKWDVPAAAAAQFPGALRLVHVDIARVVERPAALPLRWAAPPAPALPLRLTRRVRESDDVTSFHFAAAAGGELPAFHAGQFLPIIVPVPGHTAALQRTYSISGVPEVSDGGAPLAYRISVKRERLGAVSRHLHDAAAVGDAFAARPPAGSFVLPCGAGPLVFAAAGVGVTPLAAMLRALLAAGSPRRVTFAHGVRDGANAPLATELRELAAAGGERVHVHFVYSRPREGVDVLGRDYDTRGHIDGAMLVGVARRHATVRGSAGEADYVVCGPGGFMAALQSGLDAEGVRPEKVHMESFGPQG